MQTAIAPEPVVAPKPTWRGRLHQVAFVVSIPAGLFLVALGRTLSARLSTAVYAMSLATLLGTSASYHRFPWSSRALRLMQRLDHSSIFLLIAGTYTPFSVLVLHGAMRLVILALVWSGAAAGIALKLLNVERPRALGGILYIVLGWTALLAMPQFVRGLPAGATALMLVGGVLYTSGAVVLLRRRPDPIPAVFGYHEIWHAMVVTAVACHYVAILLVVLRAR